MPFWGKLMQRHSGQPRNPKLISKFSVFLHYLPVSWNKTIVKKKLGWPLKVYQNKNKTKQKKNNLFFVHHEVPLKDLLHFLSQSSMFPLQSWLPSNTLKSKSNTQNCQVGNNMKMIFATEKYVKLVTSPQAGHKHQY